MAIAASALLHRVIDTLQDANSIRWTIQELVRYLNDGQREVASHRPDMLATTAALTLVAGSRQTIPTGGLKLIEVLRNTASKKAVRQCSRELLDAQLPGWQGLPGAIDIVHFMFDPRTPKQFDVYPPAAATSSVDLTYTAMPADVAEPAAPASIWSDVTGNIGVTDIGANALIDYVLHRAFSKEAEHAVNAQRAVAHYQAFASALGIEVQATRVAAPSLKSDATDAVA